MDATEMAARVVVWLMYTFCQGLHTYRCFASGLFIIGVGMLMNIGAASIDYGLVSLGVTLYGIGMGLVAGEPFNMAISNTPDGLKQIAASIVGLCFNSGNVIGPIIYLSLKELTLQGYTSY